MASFKFNKVIIIESLDNERKTGMELHDDLNSWVPGVFNIEIEYKPVHNKEEWDKLFKTIADECENKGVSPILHLEIHGEEHGTGLVLASGEFISMEELGETVGNINYLTGCNTFMTLAVCRGLTSLFSIHMTKPMPFCGAIGSFDTIMNNDILLSFTEFYHELFNSFNIYRAYEELRKANEGRIGEYYVYMADALFIRVYKRYVNEQCSEEKLNKRATAAYHETGGYGILLEDFISNFKQIEKENRDKEYNEFKHKFFLLDKFPQNEMRFALPAHVHEL